MILELEEKLENLASSDAPAAEKLARAEGRAEAAESAVHSAQAMHAAAQEAAGVPLLVPSLYLG